MKTHSTDATYPTPAAKTARPQAKPAQRSTRLVPGTRTSTLHAASLVPFAETPERPAIPAAERLPHVRFGYFRPEAREVFLVGEFNDWNPRATPMKRDALGDWSVEIPLSPGAYRYRLMVDGEWRDDPSAQQTAMNPFGGFDAIIVV